MERKEWVLSVLYSPGKNNDTCEPINGSLRIMKILFMMGQENKNLPNFYNQWQKYLYGPCDFGVYEDISSLKENLLVEEKEQPFQSFMVFNLTAKGKGKAEESFKLLNKDVQNLIKDIKNIANSRQSLKNLLEYIYRKYPGWDTNSIFKLD